MQRILFLSIIPILLFILFTGNFDSSYGALEGTIGGTQGTGNGEFDQPWGLAVSSNGTIYVAEYYNQRIQEFDNTSDHSFSAQLIDPGIRYGGCTHASNSMELRVGDPCEPNGKLDSPTDVDLDSSGNLWVVENHRVQSFNSSGTYVSQFGSACVMNSAGDAPASDVNGELCNTSASGAVVAGDGQFYSPSSIAIDSSDNIWVADMNNNRIQKFNSSGVFQMKFGSEGCQTIQNDGRIGTNDNNIFVPTPHYNGQFCSPQALDFDSSDNLYVVDHNNRRVQVFDSSGTYLDSFGSYGTTDGKFLNPHFITIDRFDYIYVTDRERNNIQVFDDGYNFRYSITGLSDPKDIVVDSFDRLLVAYNHGVNIYTANTSSWTTGTTSLDFSTYYDVEITDMDNSLTSISIPSTNQAASLNFSGTAVTSSGGINSITFQNELEVTISHSSSTIVMIIPNGTEMSGTSWDGDMKLAGHSVTSSLSVTGQTIESSKIFGSDDVNLSFDNPVKLSYIGKSDKNIGLKSVGSSSTLISTVCNSNDTAAVASQLGGSGECKITNGSDLIAYTYHFTTFFISSDTPSTSAGGSKSNCNSNGFGKNNSLMVYQVSYDIDSYNVLVNAYSTCGAISVKMTTPHQQSMLGLSTVQPFLDDLIAVYSGYADESDKQFTISVQNKRDSFNETFFIKDESIIKQYTGKTGYTSEQQGMLSTPEKSVPDWVKNNAKWWANDEIDDDTFVSGIEYLIKEKILNVSSNNISSTSNEIPSWVKNNAKWWAEEVISEDDFISGIEYLVNQGIISVH